MKKPKRKESMKALSQMLEEIGYGELSTWTSAVLELHDYQCNGPDLDMALSKYRNREAAYGVKLIIKELIRRIDELRLRVRWSNELEAEYGELKKTLNSTH
ncbi:PaREP1 family protein [Caldivirga sp.]|uniref:PaREP1 family protein n=1 Tax=Caldivirga sp. TaxID=2080243 RepID=UPI003D0D5902